MRSDSRAVLGGRLLSRVVLVTALAVGCLLAVATVATAANFDPGLVISDGNMRAYDGMSQADIQAFLNTQKGPLKTLVTADYAGHKKPAAQIIYEACVQWHISPKVMLVMLQKEQSLLTRTTLVTGYKSTLDWAIGMGCPDSGSRIEKYRGFGNQMWWGANRLDGYGEGKNGSTIPLWKAPSTLYSGVQTKNVATYKLYVYNPSIGAKAPYGDLSSQVNNLSGNANFWHLYWKYFGDPFADPQVKTVFRFQSTSKSGGFYYTSSLADRYRFMNSKYWKYQGGAFSWDSTTSPNASGAVNSLPVYRFYDRTKHTYLYTSSTTKIAKLRSSRYSKRYRFEGEAWRVTTVTTGTSNVFCFLSKKNGTYLYTSSPRERAKYAAAPKTYRYTGAFHVVQ